MPSKRPRKTTASAAKKSGSRSPKPAATPRASVKRTAKKAAPTAAPASRVPAKPSTKPRPPSRAPGPRRADLLAQAKGAGITGTQRMTVAQLQAALARLATPPAPAPVRDAEVRPLVVATPPQVPGLPWHYGVTEVVALPVDPLLVHVYWELLPVEVARVRGALGAAWEGAQQVVGSSRVDLQACKLEYSIVSPK